MNEFDQFVKHALKIKYYARYTDDFVMIGDSREYLERLIPATEEFLETQLHLALHPQKVLIQPCHRGLDFLGYVIFPHHRVMRARTRRRIFYKIRQRIEEQRTGLHTDYSLDQTLQSYLGVLSHANTYKLAQKLKNFFWLWRAKE